MVLYEQKLNTKDGAEQVLEWMRETESRKEQSSQFSLSRSVSPIARDGKGPAALYKLHNAFG
jgi:hypothetical protein